MTKRKKGFLESLEDLGDRIEEEVMDFLGQEPDEPAGGKPEPVTKRVSLIVHNPRVPSAGNERLNKVLGWNDPAPLIKGYMDDLYECSGGYVNDR